MLTWVVMKCFERLVRAHIKANMPGTLDPLQFTHRSNSSMEDAISITIQMAAICPDKRNTFVIMLFINTIVPSKRDTKLRVLGLDTNHTL
jgi:hypothetical protein